MKQFPGREEVSEVTLQDVQQPCKVPFQVSVTLCPTTWGAEWIQWPLCFTGSYLCGKSAIPVLLCYLHDFMGPRSSCQALTVRFLPGATQGTVLTLAPIPELWWQCWPRVYLPITNPTPLCDLRVISDFSLRSFPVQEHIPYSGSGKQELRGAGKVEGGCKVWREHRRLYLLQLGPAWATASPRSTIALLQG